MKKIDFKKYGRVMVFIDFANVFIDKKGDLDIELALDATQSIDRFDTVMLFTGDSDFVPVIRFLHRRKKKAIVVSTKSHIAKELINAADRYENIKRWKKEVFKSKRARR